MPSHHQVLTVRGDGVFPLSEYRPDGGRLANCL